MAVTGCRWQLWGLRPALFFTKIALRGSFGADLHEGVTMALDACLLNSAPCTLYTT